MTQKIAVYKKWAPDHVHWSRWAKPVLFMESPYTYNIPMNVPDLGRRGISYDSMVIVDLPGKRSVEESLVWARLGYRPVPLYNGVAAPNRQSAVVDNWDILAALYTGTSILEQCTIRDDAPPVFMLDANRMQDVAEKNGMFDNRWCVFPQDMPSAAYLKKKGIRRVLVRCSQVNPDMSHILHRYQEQGLEIHLSRSTALKQRERVATERHTVAKPTRFQALRYRTQVIAGLERNAAGGFGGMVPEPTQGGGRRYGMG